MNQESAGNYFMIMFAASFDFQHDESTATVPACKQICKKAQESRVSMSVTAIQIEHLAMTTRWRLVLRGIAGQELHPVADSCAATIDKWDGLLSRFNPVSEVSRINRAKPGATLKLHPDLLDLLGLCDRARIATQGLFEVAMPNVQTFGPRQSGESPYRLDLEQGTFVWLASNHQLDFGGIAKGYVLDQLLQFVKEHQVLAALFDAGGSSLLAWDSDPEANPWLVTLSPPGEGPRELNVGLSANEKRKDCRPWVELQNMALAYSATRSPGTVSGQTIDPLTNQELTEQRACVVLTYSAAWAEILSTTALCMGEAEAAKYINEQGIVDSQLCWIDGETGRWHHQYLL